MQGNCSSDPSSLNLSAPDLLTLRAGQCVLLTDGSLMKLQDSLWLDNLYIRYLKTSRGIALSLLLCFGKGCNLWLTSVTLQGALGQVPAIGGALIEVGQLYAEGADSDHSFFMRQMLKISYSLRMDLAMSCAF
jgi:hypothetical protein